MLGAAYGLEHIHSKMFIHGDIKPDNFVVTEDWVVKLADFGEAKEEDQYESRSECQGKDKKRILRGEGAGTIIWLAPERLLAIIFAFPGY